MECLNRVPCHAGFQHASPCCFEVAVGTQALLGDNGFLKKCETVKLRNSHTALLQSTDIAGCSMYVFFSGLRRCVLQEAGLQARFLVICPVRVGKPHLPHFIPSPWGLASHLLSIVI